MPRRLILAYSLVGFAGLILVEAALGDKQGVAATTGLAWLVGTIHGVWFFVRSRRRRAPAALDRAGTVVLAATLAAVAAVTVGNLAVVTIAVPAHAKLPSEAIGGASIWMVVVGVLCWRGWTLRSARRAAVLQLVAVTLAVPILIRAIGATRAAPPAPDGSVATLPTSPLIALAVVLCAAPVLDHLFTRVADQPPVG